MTRLADESARAVKAIQDSVQHKKKEVGFHVPIVICSLVFSAVTWLAQLDQFHHPAKHVTVTLVSFQPAS